ncbi:MAG: zinc ABC transporter solute-binding protein [Papillibacter sp.]|nr:zinc ABC transporter solute-binding protein [Papillibacter sp.]
MKRLCTILLAFILLLLLTSCSSDNKAADSGKLRVTVSFNAMKEFALAVGGDRVEIQTIIPDGTEPHDFELKARDLVNLSKAQVFIYNGLGMEGWAEEAIKAADNKSLISVNASEGAELIALAEHEGEEEHGHGSYDPHLWLSLKGAETEVANIKAAFIEADPINKDYYESNCQSFIEKLVALYNKYSAKFEKLDNRLFITGHAAFAYLCRDFGLIQSSVENVFAEGEPSARQLAELADYCRKNGVSTIFTEELASPEVSKALANEVGAKTETIYTISSDEDGLSYLERMEINLSKIYDSLT